MNAPSLGELILKKKDEMLTAHRRAAHAEAKLARIAALHVDTTNDRTCDECGYTYPCRTAQILDEEPA